MSSRDVVSLLVQQGTAMGRSAVDGVTETHNPADELGIFRISPGHPVTIGMAPGKKGPWRILLANRTKVSLLVTTRVGGDELDDVIVAGGQLRLSNAVKAKVTVAWG